MIWNNCLEQLKGELSPGQFNTWIRPLQPIEKPLFLCLLAPNRYVLDEIELHYLSRIQQIVQETEGGSGTQVGVELGETQEQRPPEPNNNGNRHNGDRKGRARWKMPTSLNPIYTFEHFVEAKANQLARAVSMQVAESPGSSYNPLFICGGVGLGKTHLAQSIGHSVLRNWPERKLAYLNSERFVADMVQALQKNSISEFKAYYRSLDVLLIDDIQFFAGKERSQEEFFHTFNALLTTQCQIVLTCDRNPGEVEGLEDRLKSRFGWGLIVAIEPPDLESRVAILKSKMQRTRLKLPDDVCFFIAKHFRSNVRELEGALNRIIAHTHFTKAPVTLETCREALKDLLLVVNRQVSLENIQKTVAEYFNVRVSDLTSARRSRSIVRPRQIAMTLAKSLTNHSLPEIGKAFGDRDHTTVLHANRKISELRTTDDRIAEDYDKLMRKLSC